MASENTPKYLLKEESLSQECKELISTLPRNKGWYAANLYQYQGFWYPIYFIEGALSSQKHFQAKDFDIFLASYPKSGSTWFKAFLFTLMNRKLNPVGENHPLLTHNPHDLLPFLEHLYRGKENLELSSSPSPRLFATHIPYTSLPESIKNNSTCKLVYICRNPKDTFVSLWHFIVNLKGHEPGTNIGDAFDNFCEGLSVFGPYWNHVLEYWKQSKENPERVFFLKYEDIKEEPGVHLRRLSKFLECPFTADEEEAGLVEEIVKLCSFDNLSALNVNKNGKLAYGEENKAFFRKGQVGDWKNHLSAEMGQKIDQIMEEKFFGSGLVL